MKKLPINFFEEDIVHHLKQKNAVRSWINATIEEEKHQLQELNFIFCSDNYLLNINKQYLNHDTFTDIITFDHSEVKGIIYGDIFISIDRVKENAKTFKVAVSDELHRIIIHGTLHLLGYPDKKKEEKAKMTEMEDFYLAKREFIKG
ncbi:rRNA maturation RNase YbeY [Pedobacter glucosidilyticus]|uniref:rRNA maturation RNase YbeY n=1 Tax=Pedobacter glucosidilyticus TaxID=1122941 RepID=UPI0026EB85D6|nr:rRNA maturation RNase YbeY [Pedobacter glucosidilyticus]